MNTSARGNVTMLVALSVTVALAVGCAPRPVAVGPYPAPPCSSADGAGQGQTYPCRVDSEESGNPYGAHVLYVRPPQECPVLPEDSICILADWDHRPERT